MDWDKLRIFHAVAEAGSLTHGGQSLNLSQSAVSRHISALENELDIQLFNRHARGLVLTVEGELLFKTVRSIFAQLSSTTSQLSESKGGFNGILKVATSVALGSVWLAPRLDEFTSLYPEIRLQLILTDGELDFTMREADVAICFGETSQPDVIKEPLFTYKLKIYGSETYFKKHGRPTTPEDLDKHRLIVFGSYSTPPIENVNWLLYLGAKTGHVRDPFLTINNAYGILQGVKMGLGIASLAEFIADDHPELISILPEIKCPEIEVNLVYPKQLEDSQRIAALREFITSKIKR